MEIRVRQRSTTMKRTVNVLSKLNWGKRACAVLALCATTAIALPAQTLTTLFSFDGTDGAVPQAGLVQATNGDLYGTTVRGGTNTNGTVFKITPGGALTTLYSFCSLGYPCADGDSPSPGAAHASNGDLYGTTYSGGANRYGTVFKITPGGTPTTLYSFCSQSGCTDGLAPYAALVQAANGDLYGTTVYGGADGFGTVFKITPSGALTTLYRFCSDYPSCTDGADPYAGLVPAANGDFYGTTYGGGANGNYGTVFKITPGGTLTTLYSFCSQSGCTDGDHPEAGLVQAADGDFYGTTSGSGFSIATVFKITPTGTLTTLHSFNGTTDGATPAAGLVQATNGDFYGTASSGANGYGTVFKITPSGTLTTLYRFCHQTHCPDGATPHAGLVQDTNGDFYGTTIEGGSNNDATVFNRFPVEVPVGVLDEP